MHTARLKSIIPLLAWVAAALAAIWVVRPSYLVSILLVLGVPSLALIVRLKNSRRRIIYFSLTTAIVFAPPVELVSRLANAWDVASILPRPFGIMPLENLLFAFFNFLLGVGLYEHLSAGDRPGPVSRRIRWLIAIYLAFAILVATLYIFLPAYAAWPYWLTGLVVLGIPGVIFFIFRPKISLKTIPTTLLLATIFLAYELVALQLGYWWWPGEYLWPVSVNGRTFPLDDALIWYLISTPVLIAGYEIFAYEKTRS